MATTLFVSDDGGFSWTGPIPAVFAEQKGSFSGDEFCLMISRTKRFLQGSEYLRISAVQTSMAKEGLDVLVVSNLADITWLSGFQTIVAGGGEYFSLQPIVTSGARSGIPHSTFRRQKLAKGDCVFIEIVANYQRYNAPAMRVVSVGSPNKKVRRAFEACNASVTTLCENLRAGVLAISVIKTCVHA